MRHCDDRRLDFREPGIVSGRQWETLARHVSQLLISFAGVAIVTFVAYRLIPVNATTVGFAYLLLVLVTWGFVEAALSSVLAPLVFNFLFFPPVGTFTIADPQNWIALFSFLATPLIASRLSDRAKQAATTALLASPEEASVSRKEQVTIADEEADHLRILIDNAVEMARLDITQIDVYPEISSVTEVIREVVGFLHSEIDDRPVKVCLPR